MNNKFQDDKPHHKLPPIPRLEGIRSLPYAEMRAQELEDYARELEAALRGLMEYVGGWDEPETHPCGRAARLLEYAERQPTKGD